MTTLKEIVWSKIWVYIVAILTTITALTLLIYLEVKGPNISVEDVLEYPLTRKPVTFPLKLYVSQDFSSEQIIALHKGACAWSDATNAQAKFEIVTDWVQPVAFDPTFYQFYPDVTVWLKKSTDKSVTGLILRHGFFDGVSKDMMIVMIDDAEMTNQKLSIVFAHELGHTLGLEHIRAPYVGLMNIGGGDRVISSIDMMEFCALYDCKKQQR